MRYSSQTAMIVTALAFITLPGPAWALPPCQPLDKKPIKIEAWIAKKFKKKKTAIKMELESQGNTKARVKVFPMNKPAHVIAIGRCVPSYIARHALKVALKYAGGVKTLVDQDVLMASWIGIGTTAFDEYSQRTITQNQLDALLDESLDTSEFQKLMAEYSNPKSTIKAFGTELPNIRRSEIKPPLRNLPNN